MIVLHIDCETTGLDRARDRIVELAVRIDEADGRGESVWRFNPGMSIPAAASAIHGIIDADVAACPVFAPCAAAVRELLARAQVIVGYNVGFDLGMIDAELVRAGLTMPDLDAVAIVDPCLLWKRLEPRTLEEAVRRFVGDDKHRAHAADADVDACARVLRGMVQAFGLPADWTTLGRLSDPDRKIWPSRADWVGPTDHLRRIDGRVVLSFGKYKGESLNVIASIDAGYLDWICRKSDLPAHVKAACEDARAAR